MAYVSVDEISKGRTGSINDKNQRTYQRKFRVLMNSATDDSVTAMAAVHSSQGILLGTAHPNDSNALCNGFSAAPYGNDDMEWTVSVSYSSAFDETESQEPTQRPDQKSWSFTTKQKAIDHDLNDQAILNSANDPPVSGIEITEYQAIYQLTKNIPEANFDSSIFYSMAGKCNAAAFQGAGPGQVMFIPQSATYTRDQEFGNYWTVAYSFVFDPDRHDKIKLLDQGFNVLDGADKIKAVDGNDDPVQDAILLDGAGVQLAQDAPPVFNEFSIIELLDFGVFT